MFIFTDNRAVGRDFNTGQIINVAKFGFFRHCRTGHTGQLGIKTKIVLESNGGECLIFRLDFDAFFRFQCLMQSVAVTTSFHDTAGKFVDNQHFAVAYQIIDVFGKHNVCPQCLIDMIYKLYVFDVI